VFRFDESVGVDGGVLLKGDVSEKMQVTVSDGTAWSSSDRRDWGGEEGGEVGTSKSC
jgi:hypothetical protein